MQIPLGVNETTFGLPAFFDVWPDPITIPDTTICQGDSTAIGMPAKGGYTYEWSPGSSLTDSTTANPKAFPTSSTTYTLVANGGGCSDTATVNVNTYNSSNVYIEGDTRWCPWLSKYLEVHGAPVDYWYLDNDSLYKGHRQRVLAADTGLYEAVITRCNGIKDTLSINVTWQAPNIIQLPSDSVYLCPNDTIELTIQGAQPERWWRNGSHYAGNKDTISVTDTGTYEVATLDTCGYRDTVAFEVLEGQLPTIQFSMSNNTILCPGQDSLLTASGGNVYEWRRNNTVLPATINSVLVDTTSTYHAKIENTYGCVDSGEIFIKQLTENDLQANITINGNEADTFATCGLTSEFSVNQTSYINKFHWDFGTGNPADTAAKRSPDFTFPDTGRYEVVLKAWYSPCPADYVMDTLHLRVYEGITAAFSVDTPACSGQPVQFVNQTTADPGLPLEMTWQFTATDTSDAVNPSRTYPSPGNYPVTLTVTSPAGDCGDTLEKMIYISGPPTITAPNNVIRCTNDSALIDLEASNYNNLPDSNLHYDWTPNNNISCTQCEDPWVDPPQQSIYQVTVTNEYGCAASDQTIVVITDPPTVEAGDDRQICQGGSVTLEATPDPGGFYSYQWTPRQALGNASAQQTEAFPDDTATYTVTITSQQTGCQAQDSVTVYPSKVEANATATDLTICKGDTTQLQANNLINATYHWKPTNTISDSTARTPKAYPDTTTIYTLTVTDTVQGCASKDTVQIGVGEPPVIKVAGPNATCQGGTINLTAEGATSYQWQPSNLISCDTCGQVTTAPNQTTTYTLTGYDAYGCETTITHEVDVLGTPNLQTGNDTIICPGTKIKLTATGGSTYHWEPNNTLSCDSCPNPTAAPAIPTTYTVIASLAGGCSDTGKISIDVHPAPSDPISGYEYEICLGDTLSLILNNGQNYQWTPSQNIKDGTTQNPKFFPQDTTTYKLNMTYGLHNCPWNDSIQVNVNKGKGTLPNDTTICAGQSATLTATGYDSYQWQSNASLPCTNCNEIMVSPQQTTDYTLTATSNTGCQVDKTITVTVVSSPTITINGPDSLCANTKDTLTATGAQNYQWYPTSGIVQSTGEIQPAQTTTYTVEATVNGCEVQSTHTVNVKPLPSLQTSKDTLICLGQSTPLSTTGAQSYQWSPDSIVSCTNCPDPIATPTADITYTVTGTGANQCQNKDSVKVDVSPNPIVTVPSDTTICKGDTIQIRALDNNQHEWSPQSEVDCHTCDTVTVSPQTRTVFTVTAFGLESCTASDTVVVDVQKPTISTSSDTTVCPDENFTLTATGAQTYEWQPIGQTTATIETSIANSQNFTVTGFDPLGCTDTANIQITIHDTINPQIAGDTIVCPGETVMWTITEGQSAYWPELDTSTMALSLSTLQPLNLSTLTTDQNGCTYVRVKSLSLHPGPTLTTSPDQTIRQYEKLPLEASGASTYEWNPNKWLSDTAVANPTFQSLETGQFTYTVTGYNQYGCRDTAQLVITVEPKPEVAIPNAFSPNGDGNNDLFEVQLPDDYELLELHIYDRWGNRVFTSEGQPWDGFIDGEPAAMGTYVYVLKYKDDRGEVVEKQGNVTVVR